MAYREVRVEGAKPELRIEPGHFLTTVYQLDYFGLDDGSVTDPTASMRALFQLGSGYMIYLYVIGMRQPGEGPWFHTFWVKDCVVADVEMEEYGPPTLVACEPMDLPCVYATVSIAGAAPSRIERTTFHATADEARPTLLLRFALEGERALTWSSTHGWSVQEGERNRVLCAGDRVVFKDIPHSQT
jgi:hypothetical protein